MELWLQSLTRYFSELICMGMSEVGDGISLSVLAETRWFERAFSLL